MNVKACANKRSWRHYYCKRCDARCSGPPMFMGIEGIAAICSYGICSPRGHCVACHTLNWSRPRRLHSSERTSDGTTAKTNLFTVNIVLLSEERRSTLALGACTRESASCQWNRVRVVYTCSVLSLLRVVIVTNSESALTRLCSSSPFIIKHRSRYSVA